MDDDAFDAATATLPENLQTPEFIAAWYEWCDFRKASRKRITERACKMQLKKFEKYGPRVGVVAIEKAIAADYQGVFPENVTAAELNGVCRALPQQQFTGIKTWAERHKDDLHREYGT